MTKRIKKGGVSKETTPSGGTLKSSKPSTSEIKPK